MLPECRLERTKRQPGECAQYCRLPYSLIDADGKEIVSGKHLLSLKDMNRGEYLEELLDAGVSSLKIEGRLKDVSYVKNVTAWYRKKLDAILARRPEYRRASAGHSTYTFEPVAEKSFNRGFTPFLWKERTKDITSFDTPKSLGEPVGTVKELKGNSFTIAGLKQLNNGDGLTFFNEKGELEGFRVNRVEANRIFTLIARRSVRRCLCTGISIKSLINCYPSHPPSGSSLSGWNFKITPLASR